MKRGLIYILLLFLVQKFCFSQQVEKLNSGTNVDFYDCHFFNKDTGIVVGGFNTILRTIDGGLSWEKIYTDPNFTNYLLTISFVDKNIGYIGGEDGYFLKTIDGGKSFQPKTELPQLDDVVTMSFINKDTGYVGKIAALYKTYDGADSWQLVDESKSFYIFLVHFMNTKIGIFSGETPKNNGVLFKTINYGRTWDSLPFPGHFKITSVHFLNQDTGFATSQGQYILKTNDGGMNWEKISIGPDADTNYYRFSSIVFLNNQTGLLTGRRDYLYVDTVITIGIVYLTTDGGLDWSLLYTDSIADCKTVSLADSNTAFVVGGKGRILKIFIPSDTSNQIYPDEVVYKNVIQLFPNPGNGNIHLHIDNNILLKNSQLTFILFNIDGRIMLKFDNLDNEKINKGFEMLNSGLYIYVLSSNNKIIYTGKLINIPQNK